VDASSKKKKNTILATSALSGANATPLFDSPLFQKTPLPNSRVKGAPPPPMPAQVGANGNSKTNNVEEGSSKDDASRPKDQRCRLGSQ